MQVHPSARASARKRTPAQPVLALALTGHRDCLCLRLMPASAPTVQTREARRFLVGGLGLGMAFVPIQVAAFAGVDSASSGLAAGLINTSQEAGGALGVAIAASVAFSRIPGLTAWAGSNLVRIAQARADVFHEAFLIGAAFAALGVLVALTLPMMRASEQAGTPVG